MAFNTPLVTSTQVREETIADINFDTARLDRHILPAQRQYVKDAIGEDFYDTLLKEKEAGSFTTENQTLYDNFLKQMLSWFVLYDALPKIRNNITPQGIMTNSTEFSTQSSKEDYAGLRNNILAMAERWKKDQQEFIKKAQEDNSSAYSEYDRCEDTHQNKYGFILH